MLPLPSELIHYMNAVAAAAAAARQNANTSFTYSQIQESHKNSVSTQMNLLPGTGNHHCLRAD
jgi:hypothetical protein